MENYHIYNEIGRGAHSFVYKARRKRSIEYVAVKSTAKSRMDKVRWLSFFFPHDACVAGNDPADTNTHIGDTEPIGFFSCRF